MLRTFLLALLMTVVMQPCTSFAAEKNGTEQKKTGGVQTEDLQKDQAGDQTEDLQGDETDDQTTRLLADGADDRSALDHMISEIQKALPVILGISGDDPAGIGKWIFEQVAKRIKNPGQYDEDFWDSVFGTGANGISKDIDAERKGTVEFVMEVPDPVRMPETYSVVYHRLDKEKNEVVTLLERDTDGNIHYADGDKEMVFVRTDEGFRMYPVLSDRAGFGRWDGVLLSARSVRSKTSPFWDCADQTFIKWLGADLTEETEYLGRPCGLYRTQTDNIVFTYLCDMVIDDETGICLHYTADELLKGASFNITEDNRVEIDIEDYDIGGEEMEFYCTSFETEDISFELPTV